MNHRFLRNGNSVIALLLLIALTGTQAALAAGATNESADTVKIGFIMSLSGVAAIPGNEMLKGARTYLDQVHDQMGGHHVELIVEDDQGSPAKAVEKFRKLVAEDHVDLVFGVYFSSAAYELAPLAAQLRVPFVISAAAADDVTQRKRNDWTIRTSFTASQTSHPFGAYAAKDLKYKKVVIMASDYAYGYEASGGFQRTFEENGGKIIQKIWVPLDTKDFSALLQSVRPDADAVFLCVVGRAAEQLPAQYRQYHPKLPLIGTLTTFDESVLPVAGEYLVGGISSSVYTPGLDNPVNKAFVNQFHANFDQTPGWYALSAYSGAMWINRAIEMVRGDVHDHAKLMSALKRVHLTDPRGPISLDDYGNPVQNVYVRRLTKTGNGFVNSVIFTYPKVSQFYKWDPQKYLSEPPYARDYPPCTHCSK